MVTETRDRRINTRERMHNDGAKRLPHERDETPDAQDVQSRGIMRQAADDLEQGLVDTDLHGERGIERAVESTGSGQARPHSDAANGMRDRPANTPKTRRE